MTRRPPRAGRAIVDLVAVRASLARLDRLAEEHPELIGPKHDADNARGWEATLAEDEETMPEETKQVTFRLAVSLLERVDAYAERMSAAAPGMTISRADAVRVLLTKALDAEEHAAPKTPTKTRKK